MLVPEVQARRALRRRGGSACKYSLPHGSWIGCGTLRVLRLRMNESVDYDCGLRCG